MAQRARGYGSLAALAIILLAAPVRGFLGVLLVFPGLPPDAVFAVLNALWFDLHESGPVESPQDTN
ncbi:hypothetical protein E0493_03795 [Roseomonas sp. M0104]|uniref:Uncharacterized protein n=1 Tax=Teichococcus coralli TaxID=2545983 RepID=A0A845BAT3_9PROT|nr:hypothetical protein [Pseudoroseomonas coralli]MXP62477.1 hypothetical protein [Pseudoroseomonas coralli]